MTKPTIDELVNRLNGDPASFRSILKGKDKLLELVCDYAERRSKQRGIPAWSVISDIFGHGSGVSSCIYELYRSRRGKEKS